MGTRQQGYSPPLTTPKHFAQLWAPIACLALINRGMHAFPAWTTHFPEVLALPEARPSRTLELILGILLLWTCFPKSDVVSNKALFRKTSKDAFGHLPKFWEASPRICVAKEETFQSPHIIYRDMFPAKMLPGNRTFLWERTQTTHLAGMPSLRAWDSIKTWGALCSQISIIWQGLGAYLPYGGLSS